MTAGFQGQSELIKSTQAFFSRLLSQPLAVPKIKTQAAPNKPSIVAFINSFVDITKEFLLAATRSSAYKTTKQNR